MKNKLPLALFQVLSLLIMASCSRSKVWSIEHRKDGGRLAYQGDSKDLEKKISKEIPCKPYKITQVNKRSQVVEKVYNNYVTSSPATNSGPGFGPATGGSAVHQRTPIFDQQREEYKEIEYICLKH